MRISVIIISYNQIKETAAVLRALNTQSYSDFEVIVVDDGSIPHLHNHLESRYQFPLKVHYIPRSDDSSRANARNQGAKLADGKLLVFLDGDTIPNVELLKSYSRYFDIMRNRKVVVGTRVDLTRSDSDILISGSSEGSVLDFSAYRSSIDERLRIANRLRRPLSEIEGSWIFFVSCNFCVEKSLFEELGGFDTNFKGWGSEDIELGYRLILNNYRFDILSNQSYHLVSSGPTYRNEDKYRDWIRNIGIFYRKYSDLKILYLFLVNDIVYNCFHLGRDWDTVAYANKIQTFFVRCASAKERESSLRHPK